LSELYGPLETISNQVATLQSSLTSAGRVFEVLDETPEVIERSNARSLTRAAGAIEFRHVSFGYEPTRAVLHDLTVSVPPGASVGVQGRTGAGKTTLVSLLTRFYDPTSGHILLDGVDLRDYRLADLRHQFGLVLQESVLFPATLAENIAYGRPDATESQIVAAARAADAHAFIEHLPEGYQTWVGERGMTLSGGERQRIALARAFLKDAPILILDEPTSAVDRETERAIMTAIERLMKGRTTFLISHRPSALEHCDMLISVADGRLTDVTVGAA
jgi:ATP-binding cassette subfamily B protein